MVADILILVRRNPDPVSFVTLTHLQIYNNGSSWVKLVDSGVHWQSDRCIIIPHRQPCPTLQFVTAPLLPQSYRITARIARLKSPWNSFHLTIGVSRVAKDNVEVRSPVTSIDLSSFWNTAFGTPFLCPQEDALYEVVCGELIVQQDQSTGSCDFLWDLQCLGPQTGGLVSWKTDHLLISI